MLEPSEVVSPKEEQVEVAGPMFRREWLIIIGLVVYIGWGYLASQSVQRQNQQKVDSYLSALDISRQRLVEHVQTTALYTTMAGIAQDSGQQVKCRLLLHCLSYTSATEYQRAIAVLQSRTTLPDKTEQAVILLTPNGRDPVSLAVQVKKERATTFFGAAKAGQTVRLALNPLSPPVDVPTFLSNLEGEADCVHLELPEANMEAPKLSP